MIELCKLNNLRVVREAKFGIFLSEDEMSKESVLLPRKEVPEGTKIGDDLSVFIYLDSEDRPIATLKKPFIELGCIACLEVVQTTKIGAFLNWNLDKDLLLPFKEQIKPVRLGEPESSIKEGDKIPVILYIDKSGRPAATMRVYNYLAEGGNYTVDSAVEGRVIEINPGMGIFIAIDDKYFGMIPIREVHEEVKLGDLVYGRVTTVRDDGKYMISPTQKAHIQMDNDGQIILKILKEEGGELPFGDKSDAEDIKRKFHMSKNAFKRAIGHLYKDGLIVLEPKSIMLK